MVVCNTMENLLNRKPEMSGNGIAVQDTNYQAGDIVTWELKGNRPHIGIVSDRKIGDRPLIIHNIGLGTREDDILYRYTITGHFRLPVQ